MQDLEDTARSKSCDCFHIYVEVAKQIKEEYERRKESLCNTKDKKN